MTGGRRPVDAPARLGGVLVACIALAGACGRRRAAKPDAPATDDASAPVVMRFVESVVKDVPATVDENAIIGSDAGDRYYTEEGAWILTPPNGMTSPPVTVRTIDKDGRVICPRDGIRVKGTMSLAEFRGVVEFIKTWEPPPPAEPVVSRDEETGGVTVTIPSRPLPLTSRRISLIWVVAPDHLEVQTITPPKGGYCRNGDSVELRKENGRWVVKRMSTWFS